MPSDDEWRTGRSAAATGAAPADSQAGPGLDYRSRMAAALEQWWEDKTRAEIEGVVPKAIEYSSSDLEDLGRQWGAAIGWGPELLADRSMLTQLGIVMYAQGKLARIWGALREGRSPSDDSVFDLAVYTKMMQRAREFGSWPGVRPHTEEKQK